MSTEMLEKKIMDLRRTLAWMDLVMANVNECILVLDKDWRIVFINSYMAELLDQNRVLLLGRYVWEISPFENSLKAEDLSKQSIESINKLNGIYNLKVKTLNFKLLLQGKYVDTLEQAICIMSNVSMELNASSELIKLNEKIAALEADLDKKSPKRA